MSGRNKEKFAMSLWGKIAGRNIVVLTRRRCRCRCKCRFAQGAIISWYTRGDAEPAGAAKETRKKGNHNFQLSLSCAYSLHHADNIVLYFQAAVSFPACRNLLLRHLRISRWLYTKTAPDFSSDEHYERDDKPEKTLEKLRRGFLRSFEQDANKCRPAHFDENI